MTRSLLVATSSVKALENVRGSFRRNFRSVVAYTDFNDVIMLFGRNQNLTAVSIVFNRILHQVLQGQRNHFPVAIYWQRFRDTGFDLKLASRTEDSGVFQASFQQLAQIELRRPQCEPTSIGARKQQQILRYRIESARLLQQVRHSFSMLVGQSRLIQDFFYA